MIFIDANVFVYVAGRPHPLRDPSRQVIAIAEAHPEAFCTDAEVFQELLYRYMELRQWPEKRLSFQHSASVMDGRIEPMFPEDVALAANLTDRYPRLSARDLIHVAVMQRVGATHVVTADRAFDSIEGIDRLDPASVDEWRSLVI